MHNTPPCPSVGEIPKELCFEPERQPVRTLLGLCARRSHACNPKNRPQFFIQLEHPTLQRLQASSCGQAGACVYREGFWDWEVPSSV